MKNKKIKNATKTTYDGIEFKSALEVMAYKTLKAEGLSPQYEGKVYVLWEGFIPKKVPLLIKNRFKKKDYRIVKLGDTTVQDNRPVDSVTYTPDFSFDYKGKHIIVECKGFQNDVFPYKFKMFRKHLEELEGDYELWEIFTKKQLLECIQHLKESD